MNRWCVALGLGLVVAVAGCGLSDYEARMLEAQKQFQRFDEENKLLDKPVNVPSRQENNAWVRLANLFFRPPRGIQETFVQQPRADLLYEYYPRGAAGTLASGMFSKVELGFASGQKDFPQAVLACFQPLAKVQLQQRRVSAWGRELAFDSAEFEDASGVHISVNIFNGRTPVAVVFWVAKGQSQPAARTIEVSLGTFALDADAAKLQAMYNQGSPWLGKK